MSTNRMLVVANLRVRHSDGLAGELTSLRDYMQQCDFGYAVILTSLFRQDDESRRRFESLRHLVDGSMTVSFADDSWLHTNDNRLIHIVDDSRSSHLGGTWPFIYLALRSRPGLLLTETELKDCVVSANLFLETVVTPDVFRQFRSWRHIAGWSQGSMTRMLDIVPIPIGVVG